MTDLHHIDSVVMMWSSLKLGTLLNLCCPWKGNAILWPQIHIVFFFREMRHWPSSWASRRKWCKPHWHPRSAGETNKGCPKTNRTTVIITVISQATPHCLVQWCNSRFNYLEVLHKIMLSVRLSARFFCWPEVSAHQIAPAWFAKQALSANNNTRWKHGKHKKNLSKMKEPVDRKTIV